MIRNGVGWRMFSITYYWSNTALHYWRHLRLVSSPQRQEKPVQPSEGLVTLDLVLAAGIMLRHGGGGPCVCFVLLMNGPTRVRHYIPQLKR